ncbi:MAG: ABC transporter substrate-binding protein [Gammaproteobacteria bacterium]|nr:ABC transporter substrate-binding protein [Gammaproteobacteria bacterium]
MRGLTGIRALFAALIMLSSCAVAAIEDPQALVRQTGDKVLAEVSARKAELEADPRLIYPLVESTVLPHFDFRSMSQSALGRFWRDATDAQKDGVTREFRELLVRTYATALLGYSGQQIEYLPVQYASDADNVMIPTRIASSGAPPIPINYRLKRTDSRWLVYDVVIDGVSLITNYRSQFTTLVRRGGIDGLITALAEKNRNTPVK